MVSEGCCCWYDDDNTAFFYETSGIDDKNIDEDDEIDVMSECISKKPTKVTFSASPIKVYHSLNRLLFSAAQIDDYLIV